MKIPIGAVVLLFLCALQAAASNDCKTPTYENRNQVDYGPLELSRVAGVAIDATGAPVPRTCVYLFTEKTHRLAARAEVESNGAFAFQNVKAGSYRLVAVSDVFCTANVPFTFADRATHKRLVAHMKMGEIDVCSYGDYK